MKLKGSTYCYIGAMGIAIVTIALSLPIESPKSKLLPLIIGGIVFVMTGIGLWRDLLEKDSKPAKETKENADSEDDGGSWRGYLAIGAWILGFFLAIYLSGFVIASLLLVLAYIKSHGAKWVTAVSFALATTAFIYGIFEVALKMNLYKGLFFALLSV